VSGADRRTDEMKRTKISEERIIAVLKEAVACATTADLARRHRVFQAAI
jgi:hypothetical protein